ncbi:hypothetical protein RJ639_036832 [Escallonia herrerae]|uniref:Uncharacterized protein n=1 Tax=Escallonia herrerae TaxID=1293975 RepID=A0AA88WNX1_9ASTE|nr:hypothetical protein RJ639_036832 [Escallonia herrerae]
MAAPARLPSSVSAITLPQVRSRSLNLWKSLNHQCTFNEIGIKLHPVCCTNMSSWEPSPVKYAPDDDAAGDFLKGANNIFETLKSNRTIEAPLTNTEVLTDTSTQPSTQLQYLRWPMWLLGPPLLLATGMVPTLWLPISSIFLGPNIASVLSLTGLDCIFNLGASLFLLMADSCARPNTPTQVCKSQAPLSYRFWNMVATMTGFIIPLSIFFGAHRGFLQPQLPFISSAVLLGPYLLLLSVQMLTEMLTWHWKSPVWLVTPIVYEAYRVLQLMRGLKLGAELSAPSWMQHTIRGLVCWWVLILGMQLMRVAWYAGFAASARQQQSSDLSYAENT